MIKLCIEFFLINCYIEILVSLCEFLLRQMHIASIEVVVCIVRVFVYGLFIVFEGCKHVILFIVLTVEVGKSSVLVEE